MNMKRCCVLMWRVQLGEREDCVETSVDIAPKRDNMLQQLLNILNTESLPQATTTRLTVDDTQPSVTSRFFLVLN